MAQQSIQSVSQSISQSQFLLTVKIAKTTVRFKEKGS